MRHSHSSSSIKQNLQYAQTPMILEILCRWRDKGWKLAELNRSSRIYAKMIGILMMILN
jgi:tRNA(Phe) wybutosine-synthesizing methylase Tyw3